MAGSDPCDARFAAVRAMAASRRPSLPPPPFPPSAMTGGYRRALGARTAPPVQGGPLPGKFPGSSTDYGLIVVTPQSNPRAMCRLSRGYAAGLVNSQIRTDSYVNCLRDT